MGRNFSGAHARIATGLAVNTSPNCPGDVEVRSLRELDYEMWLSIISLYRGDPLSHIYLLYDLVYELDRTELYAALHRGQIVGYLLVWRGGRILAPHLWGCADGLLELVPRGPMIAQVWSDTLADRLAAMLSAEGLRAEKRYYLDMVVDESTFKPYNPQLARRLKESDAEQLAELKRVQGRSVSIEEARRLIRENHYYGVFADGQLVSIACAYIRSRDVWIVGDVYTHPQHRGKGYAKAVTSAVTRDAIASGAVAMLHVEEVNEPAIRVYRKLGYRVVRRKPWVIAVKT